LRNLPMRPLAWLLRLVIFPSGLPFHQPTDRLDHRVATLLLRPSEVRDRLTLGVFTTLNPQLRFGQLEQALVAVAEAIPLERTLRRAKRAGQLKADDEAALIEEAINLGILSEKDRETLQTVQALADRIIQVNAFDGLSEQEMEEKKSGDKASLLHRLGVA
ncbi:MAG: DUF1974 domain-containing protein, partial [Chromatiales bacterium]